MLALQARRRPRLESLERMGAVPALQEPLESQEPAGLLEASQGRRAVQWVSLQGAASLAMSATLRRRSPQAEQPR